MPDIVTVEVRLDIRVTDAGALTAAAIAKFDAEWAPTRTPESAEQFRQHLRENPTSAVQSLLVPEAMLQDIPGVESERWTSGGVDPPNR